MRAPLKTALASWAASIIIIIIIILLLLLLLLLLLSFSSRLRRYSQEAARQKTIFAKHFE